MFDIDWNNFKKLATERGYYSFHYICRNGIIKMRIVKKLNENKVRVEMPLDLYDLLIECSLIKLDSRSRHKLQNSLMKDRSEWTRKITALLPNHFFEWMDRNLKTHKKHLTSAVLKEYLSQELVDRYKGGAFIRMIKDYEQFKGYTVKWSKGKTYFWIGPGVQTQINFDIDKNN